LRASAAKKLDGVRLFGDSWSNVLLPYSSFGRVRLRYAAVERFLAARDPARNVASLME
jgi:hypothetical protein